MYGMCVICVGSCGVRAASFSVQCPQLNNSSIFINIIKMICEMTPMGWSPYVLVAVVGTCGTGHRAGQVAGTGVHTHTTPLES